MDMMALIFLVLGGLAAAALGARAAAAREGFLPAAVNGLLGLAALLAMLNSCASGCSVVNIDNGFGAGYLASMINQMEGLE